MDIQITQEDGDFGAITARIPCEDNWPHLHVARIPLLDDEFQIEQGRQPGPTDTKAMDNDVISIPFEVAVELAHTILKIAGEE